MNNTYEAIIKNADREFYGDDQGRSINGLSLLPLLKSFSIEQATYEGTFEGYTVWEIALHLAYCKYYFAKHAGNENIEYPFDIGLDGFSKPKDSSLHAWIGLIEYLSEIHNTAMNVMRSMENNSKNEKLGEWSLSKEDGAIWLCSHDTYHISQINNMGVPGLKKPKLQY